jgi:hypothetical protein
VAQIKAFSHLVLGKCGKLQNVWQKILKPNLFTLMMWSPKESRLKLVANQTFTNLIKTCLRCGIVWLGT